VKTCNIWPFEIDLCCSTDSQFHSFPTNNIISFLVWLNNDLLCVYIFFFLYTFISHWAPRLIPQLGYYELCRLSLLCVDLYLFRCEPTSGTAGS
jgi:hypothetical protein